MAFYEMFPQGIPASLKSEMNTVLNKKFGTTGQDYPTEDWPEDVNLLGLLEEKTQASASVCAFDDGADDVPAKSVKVTIPASLSGVSSVSETQTGRNVRQNVTDYSSVNPVFFQYRNYYAGQATGYPKLEGTFKAGTYTLSFDTNASITASKVGVWAKKKSDQNWYNLSANGDLVTPTSSGYSFCSASSGHVTGTFTINEECDALGFGYYQYGTSIPYTNLMLEFGSTAHDYEPYQTPTQYTASLGRTIYGGQVDIVNGEGQATWKKIVADGVNVKVTGGYASGANRLPTIQVADAGTTPTDIKADYLTTTASVIGTEDSILLGNSGTSIVLHIGTIQGNDGTHGYSSDAELLTACNSYLADHNLTIVYKLSDANATDFTFTGQEVPTRLGYNAFWSDEGDTEVTYRSSGTETIITPVLVTKTITENGTYNAADDSADGYSSVTVNVPGVPSGSHEDPLNGLTAVKYNTGMVFSGFYIDNGTLKTELAFESRSASGYEGFQIDLSNYNLVPGTTYEITFVLYVPNDISFNGSYPWGIKYSSTAITNPAGSSFNITPDVDFLEQTGTQSVTMQFTASSNNYLLVLFSRYANGTLGKVTILRNINISEVTP